MADDPSDRALSDSGGTGKLLVPQRDGELSTAVEAAQDFMAASRSKATLRAYKSDWHDFEKWCDRHCLITLPAAQRQMTRHLRVGDETHNQRKPRRSSLRIGGSSSTTRILRRPAFMPPHPIFLLMQELVVES
jgi:hypothetical protein